MNGVGSIPMVTFCTLNFTFKLIKAFFRQSVRVSKVRIRDGVTFSVSHSCTYITVK